MKNNAQIMTTGKFTMIVTWTIFAVLLFVIVILASITNYVPFLQKRDGKMLISACGLFFFISLATAVMTTVIVGYKNKKAEPKKGLKNEIATFK